jgi:hypothetical protein
MQFKDLTLTQKIEEVLACVAFILLVVGLCFMPDLTR